MNRKASELAAFAEQAYEERWGYVWGADGKEYEEAYARKLLQAYGTAKYNEKYYMEDQMKRWEGRKVVDCSGLIQAFRDGIDDTAHGLYSKSIKKGVLATFDGMPGTLVYCIENGVANHVGVVVDDGYVIHASSSTAGVIKEKLSTSKRGWTHWGRANFIEYEVQEESEQEEIQEITVLKKGSKGEAVIKLQELLNEKETAKLEIDGVFGQKTWNAVVGYQLGNGLVTDGIVGKKTWEKLLT